MSIRKRLWFAAGILSTFAFAPCAHAAAIAFHPATPYVQTGDASSLFDSEWAVHIEDFEDNSIDPFLDISGNILPPFFGTGADNLTDSIDGDDGTLDGNGNAGYSLFNSNRSITITFESPVTNAGLVWTDGDPNSAGVTLEAFDDEGMSLGIKDYMDLADDSFTGETAEDRFIGATDMSGIKSLIVSNLPDGNGIEIDHVHWQDCSVAIPEPAAFAMLLFGLLGIGGFRRR